MQTIADRSVLEDLQASKQRWARLPVQTKIG